MQTKFKKLAIYQPWNAGRNDSGKIIFRTRSKRTIKMRSYQINYKYNYNKLAFISSFQFLPFKNKLISLIFFSNGAVTQILTTTRHRIFTYFWLIRTKSLKRYLPHTYVQYLGAIHKLSIISMISLKPELTAQYCRATGCFCKIITLDDYSSVANVQLPSKNKKLFSFYTLVYHGKIMGYENKKFFNTKAGYWRQFGIKPIVRGVAKNPVDHPHGGRTKAIRHQRTPWGFTTKLK